MKSALFAMWAIFIETFWGKALSLLSSFLEKETHDPEKTIREVLAEDAVIQKQRDTALGGVDDTDRMWSDWGNQGKH